MSTCDRPSAVRLTGANDDGRPRRMIIGVAGRNGAGKGEVIKLLLARGYECSSLSDVIRKVLSDRGLPHDRDLMTQTGNELRAEGGSSVLADRLLESMPAGKRYAVDSVRHPAEVEALRGAGQGFKLVWVQASESVRFERSLSRQRDGDATSLEQFREHERREEKNADPNAQQLDAVEALADHVVNNDGDIAALETALDAIL